MWELQYAANPFGKADRVKYEIEELREVVELVKKKNFAGLEERWLELAEDPPDELKFYDSMTRALLKAGKKDVLCELFSLVVLSLIEKDREKEALEIVRTAWGYAPDLADLREPAVEALEKIYADRKNLKRFVMAAGLDGRADLSKALERFEELIYCDEGEVFEHKSFGIGIVEEIDPENSRVLIDFSAKGTKNFAFEGVKDFLQKHERSGFTAERLRNPDALKQRAMETGAEFVRFVLKGFPKGLSQTDLKPLMLDGVMSKQEWDRWWADNRNAIRRDPYIDWTPGVRTPMRLRREPKGYYETVVEEFAEAESVAKRMSLLAEIAKHLKEETAPEDFADRLVGTLKHEFEMQEKPAQKLEIAYLGHEVASVFPGVELPDEFNEKALLDSADDPADVVLGLSAHDLQCRAVESLAKSDAHKTADLCARMLPDAPPRLANWLVDWLIGHGDTEATASALETILNSPKRNPETFLSAMRQYIEGKYAALPMEVMLHIIVRELVAFLKDLQNQIDHRVPNAATLRGVQVKLKNFIAEDKHHFLRTAIAPLSAADAREVCRLFESHAAFPDSYLNSLLHDIHIARPDLDEEAARIRAGDIDDSVLYVSEESLRKRRAELQHLRSVEIPKNSKEIGEAASLGDLSENAEYEAARHRQRILFDRAGELQSDIEKARVIDPNWIRDNCVWVGTRFEARNETTGETETFTILGAWDSEPERKILSYKTPAAERFLRKTVGDRIKVDRPESEPVEYEILSIEKAM